MSAGRPALERRRRRRGRPRRARRGPRTPRRARRAGAAARPRGRPASGRASGPARARGSGRPRRRPAGTSGSSGVFSRTLSRVEARAFLLVETRDELRERRRVRGAREDAVRLMDAPAADDRAARRVLRAPRDPGPLQGERVVRAGVARARDDDDGQRGRNRVELLARGRALLRELRLVVAEADDDAVPLREARAEDPHPERVADGRDRVGEAGRRRRHVGPQRLERRSGLRAAAEASASASGPAWASPGPASRSSRSPSAAPRGAASARASGRGPRRGSGRSGRSGGWTFPSTSSRRRRACRAPRSSRPSRRGIPDAASLPARIGPPYHTKSAFWARAGGARPVKSAERTAAARAVRGERRVIGAPMVTPAVRW